MKIWDVLRRTYRKVDSILDCFILYASSCAFDILTSMHFPPGAEERNPFSKHSDGSFWLRHALIVDGVWSLEALIMSAILYIGARGLGSRWAKFAAGLPWIYFAWAHLDAGFTNVLYEIPGLYVQSARDVLQRLLGQ